MLKENKRKIVLSLLVVLLLSSSFSLAARAEEDIKIVYVDIDIVFEAHPTRDEAREKLELEVQRMRQELGALEGQEQQSRLEQFQQQLQELENELMGKVFEDLRQDIQRIADDKGYDYVVGANMLLAGGRDVTEEVLAELR